MEVSRKRDLCRLYGLLGDLERRIGGLHTLTEPGIRRLLPRRGVYFFFELGESRSDTGEGLRVTRVGTHAVSEGSRSTLANRLAQHRGSVQSGGGNHRGSIFRLLIGEAIANRSSELICSQWGKGSSAPRDVVESEYTLEKLTSEVISRMPFVWLAVDDEASKESLRSRIERNSIALLSNYPKPDRESLDMPSPAWLGKYSLHKKVCASGLWNNRCVDEEYDPAFLDVFSEFVQAV